MTVKLRPRELDVLKALADGLDGADVALRLGITPSTVSKHKTRLYRALEMNTAAGAVAEGFRRGLLK